MCTFLPFCRRVSVCLSAYSVAVLSIKRYRVIVNLSHVRVSSNPTWRGIVATIFGVWIVAALFAVPSAVSIYQCVRDAVMIPKGIISVWLFLNSYHPVYFHCVWSASLTSWQPAILRKALVLYLKEHKILKRTHSQIQPNCGGPDCFFSDRLFALSYLLDLHHLGPIW
jgi:hypothetical protein